MNAFVRSSVVMLMLALPSVLSAQTSSSFDAIEQAANGFINWTNGEVYAKGIGAPPAQTANAAQARAMAERAAFVVALRNLLETVKGVRVDSESLVENFMVKSDVIRTKVDGIVKGAQVVKKQYLSDGSVEVLVGMNMKGAFLNAVIPDRFGSALPPSSSLITKRPSDSTSTPPAAHPPAQIDRKPEPAKPVPAPSVPEARTEPIKPAPPVQPRPEARTEPLKPAPPLPPTPAPKAEPVKPVPSDIPAGRKEPVKPAPSAQPDNTVSFKGGTATGLVIDGRGLGLRPALLPRIVDQQGQEVYVGQVVTRTNAVEQGVAGYAKDVNAAANNFRVTDNPAVIKGLSAAGSAKTDIVIGQADAQSLRQLSSKGDFLQNCRVIIVY